MGHSFLCVLGVFFLSSLLCRYTEADKLRATLTAEETIIPAGGSVTLSCSVEASAGWKFDWFRRGLVYSVSQIIKDNDLNGVLRVTEGGLYSCRGRRGDPVFHTETSIKITIEKTVSIKPSMILRPNWPLIYSSETVTLRCQILGGGGPRWLYEWSPNTFKKAATSSEYRIIRAPGSDSGEHSCRGRSGYLLTNWSNVIKLTVSPDEPRASVRADKTIIPAGGRITLSCSVDTSDGWSFDWFRRESKSSQYVKYNNPDSVSEGGLYSCRGGRGDPGFYTQNSTEVTIEETYKDDGIILESPVHPVTEGDPVTLSCRTKQQKLLSSVFFYHNNTLLQNDGREELKISAVSKSDEGFYRCEHSGQESPQSWMSVQVRTAAVSSPVSSLFLVLLIVGPVVGVLLIILLILLWRCRQSKDLFCIRPKQSESSSQSSTTNHGVNQTESHVYSSVLHGDVSLYESIKPHKAAGNDADGSRNVKYSLSELRHLQKKKGAHEPEEDHVYCNVEKLTAEKKEFRSNICNSLL
ncbi:Down syndrome cell adhesion molecule homolog [Kryptolebias marmoratus]|uniref:Down syndrome cell adhesion molecule homolog n=1 Tax=Kryptolebias marmoratus TaxID=37003 RepID=UPI0018ACF82F|nr:Down syndrome cell adhesion molecule homolog [Kryptolebias marmoratus]